VSGSATRHFIAQRVSAILLVVLGLWFALSIKGLGSMQYHVVVDFLSAPLHSALLALLSIAMAFHSYLGIQVIIEDYVHGPRLCWLSLLLSRAAHLVIGILCVYKVYEIGFGA
jgi:succinate dehydrogenase / fumarate reductase membrane anchor subunit